MENKFNFRKNMIKIHKPIKVTTAPEKDEVQFLNTVYVDFTDEVIETALKDFIDFMKKSFKINLVFKPENEAFLKIYIDSDKLKEARGYMGRRTIVNEKGITIYGFDNRAIAQSLYFPTMKPLD